MLNINTTKVEIQALLKTTTMTTEEMKRKSHRQTTTSTTTKSSASKKTMKNTFTTTMTTMMTNFLWTNRLSHHPLRSPTRNQLLKMLRTTARVKEKSNGALALVGSRDRISLDNLIKVQKGNLCSIKAVKRAENGE